MFIVFLETVENFFLNFKIEGSLLSCFLVELRISMVVIWNINKLRASQDDFVLTLN